MSGEVSRRPPIERLSAFRNDRRSAPAVLAVAMAVASVLILHLGRGTTFSADEMVWVGSMPGIDGYTVFQPHGGHLLALTKLVYWPILEIFGLGYLPFRLLSLAAILTTVWLLFVYGRRRCDQWVALAPCLVLLFFGSDYLHLFQGNGFTVMLSLALGLGALLALDRNDRSGDLLACLCLSVGIFAYTVILPFVVGVGLLVLLREDRWRRIWIVAIPAAIYIAWRLWLIGADVPSGGGGVDLKNLGLIPAWTFQSLSGILNAYTGFSFPFSGSSVSVPVGLAGPPLALAALFIIGRRISRGGLSRDLAVAILIVVSLFALQAMAAISDETPRLPGSDSRYMYPGAIVLALVGFEVARRWRPDRSALIAILLVTCAGVATNVMLMKDGASLVRASGDQLRSYTGAIQLALESDGAKAPPVDYHRVGTSYIQTLQAMAVQDFGRFGYGPEKMSGQPADRRKWIDLTLSLVPVLEPLPAGEGPAGPCRDAQPDATGSFVFESGPGTLELESRSGGELTIGRFGDSPSAGIGTLVPEVPASLTFPRDPAPQPWRVGFSGGDLKLCSRP